MMVFPFMLYKPKLRRRAGASLGAFKNAILSVRFYGNSEATFQEKIADRLFWDSEQAVANVALFSFFRQSASVLLT